MATQNITDAQTLYAALSARAAPEEAQHMAAYMKNRFSFFGIRKPELNRLLKPFLKATRCRPVDWGFVEACWQAEEREMQYAALLYLQARKSALHAKDLPALHRLITHKSWWDSIDVLDRIVGDIALRHPHLNATLLDWSTDDNFWLRRIAIDHQLLRKERTDTALLAQILINNLGQKEFFINKAIGWALRDYSKTNPEWVRQFIATHRDRMAQLSLREAQKYL
ncbi:DNA alkylation repair protein [Lysobacteraceae bacterium NML07-0707]|nr:DNA alkylation repair protein [Xanthomonadaceae bacterium NML07-0707]